MGQLVDITAPLEQEGTKSVVKAWHARIGDALKLNDPIVELETDKVAVEVAAEQAGVLAGAGPINARSWIGPRLPGSPESSDAGRRTKVRPIGTCPRVSYERPVRARVCRIDLDQNVARNFQ